jgi:hypothetical protein
VHRIYVNEWSGCHPFILRLPYIIRHLVRVANALSGVRSGLIANSKIETVSKLTLIVLDFTCRALRAETPLLANDLAECGLTPFSILFVT